VDINGTPPKEAASALGLTFNKLNIRLNRARQRLREKVEATCHVCSKQWLSGLFVWQ
jgi:DNA-directed RNA polymerase specialized sigma24 family protein